MNGMRDRSSVIIIIEGFILYLQSYNRRFVSSRHFIVLFNDEFLKICIDIAPFHTCTSTQKKVRN